jgi:hypothetical protein
MWWLRHLFSALTSPPLCFFKLHTILQFIYSFWLKLSQVKLSQVSEPSLVSNSFVLSRWFANHLFVRSPKHTPQKTPKVKNPSQFITQISWQYWIFQAWTINQYWLAFQCNADMVKCRLCIELCPLLWITHLKWKNGNLQMILNPKETGWTRRVELDGLTT